MTKETVDHHKDKQCFTLTREGKDAVLEYRLADGGVNFTHTYVPPELRGQGLAESLVRHGLKWAREEGYDISASCWYVAKFLRQHPSASSSAG